MAVLNEIYQVEMIRQWDSFIRTIKSQQYSLVVIDTAYFDADPERIEGNKDIQSKIMFMGNCWAEEKQVEAMVSGVAGYAEKSIESSMMIKTVKSILNGDIWIQRHLIPKVIDHLVQLNNPVGSEQFQQDIHAKKLLLEQLTKRELDVAKMIQKGKSNKKISEELFISERTVKAHLSSIFRKLGVLDRLQLALFLKDVL